MPLGTAIFTMENLGSDQSVGKSIVNCTYPKLFKISRGLMHKITQFFLQSRSKMDEVLELIYGDKLVLVYSHKAGLNEIFVLILSPPEVPNKKDFIEQIKNNIDNFYQQNKQDRYLNFKTFARLFFGEGSSKKLLIIGFPAAGKTCIKKSFFDHLPASAFALVNVDDKNGGVMLQNTKAKKYSYALKTEADYKARIIENQFNGLLLNVNGQEVWTKLIGHFNAYNLLAIYATTDLLGVEKYENLRILSELDNVSGRFQHAVSKGGVNAIIDYAHTPDALKNVLETINSIRTFNEQVITVVGCGGDRDRTKRPKMGNIASSLSNQVVFTSDNPRSEDPQQIIDEVEAGVRPENYKKTISIVDRKQAIKTACKLAQQGDIILIAGKGHETYQIIGDQKTGFDDFEITNQLLTELNK